jgi:two-component system sensor histidine kinase DesK
VSGVPVSLSPAVEEVASWVVREASTNVVKHAHADRCKIVLSRVPGGLSVEVADDGAASAGDEPVRSGNGLSGLAERIAAIDGSFAVGPVDGWFTVRAVIPA